MKEVFKNHHLFFNAVVPVRFAAQTERIITELNIQVAPSEPLPNSHASKSINKVRVFDGFCTSNEAEQLAKYLKKNVPPSHNEKLPFLGTIEVKKLKTVWSAEKGLNPSQIGIIEGTPVPQRTSPLDTKVETFTQKDFHFSLQ